MRRPRRGWLATGVRVVDYGIRGMHLAYDLLDGCDALVLVDALPDRGAPGTVHVFEADHERRRRRGGLDAHAMDPAAVFASLNALGGTLPHTVVVGCRSTASRRASGCPTRSRPPSPTRCEAVEDVAVAQLLAPVQEG